MENHPDLQADAEMHGKAIGHYKKCLLHSYGPTPVERSVRMHPSLNFTCNLLRVLACAERYTSGIVFTSSSFIKNRNCVILQTFFVIKTIHHQCLQYYKFSVHVCKGDAAAKVPVISNGWTA